MKSSFAGGPAVHSAVNMSSSLQLLENINALSAYHEAPQRLNNEEEWLSEPYVVEVVEAMLDSYAKESDEICRNIILKTIQLYDS